MPYRVQFNPYAQRLFRKLPPEVQHRLRPHIGRLAEEPRPPGAQAMQGLEVTYRIRVGDYRIIYEIHDQILIVLVVAVGHRRDIYRK